MLAPVYIVFGGWTGLLMAVVGAAYGAYLMTRPPVAAAHADGFSWWSPSRRRPSTPL